MTLLIDFLEIDVGGGRVVGISGYHSYTSWSPYKLNVPNYAQGQLYFTGESEAVGSKRIA